MLYSFLLAQLAADKRTQTKGYQYSRHTQLERWVDFFCTVLKNIAWVFQITPSGPTDLKIKDAKFTLSNLALEIMSGNSMAGDVNTFKKVFSTYNALSSSDSAVKAFTKSAYDKATHDVTIIVASVHQDGLVNLLLVSLQGVKDSTSRPLSHTYITKEIKTKKMLHSQLIFNQELYAKTRQGIADKLKPYIKDGIKEVTLKELF